MEQIIECIPNFSEGRNPLLIKEITDAIEGVTGIKLLDVSSGRSTNRTVVTFAGNPQSVLEAAFQGIKKASQIIDMRKHEGVHPRFGATDVCPLVPVSNITMEETVEYARRLAERVGKELSIPVFCYEHAAFSDERRSLAYCRQGGYEGLRYRLTTSDGKPDYYNSLEWDDISKTGAVAIGARNFLVAYNVNLNTTSTRIASSIALDVRESGRVIIDEESGKPMHSNDGRPIRKPGTLQKTRAIGWYVDDFGVAQVSMNLIDLSVTSVHKAFEEVSEKARDRGVRVTGSELVGLIPLQSLLDAGKYFLEKQNQSTGISDEEILKIAVKSLGLDDYVPFNPKMKVIEYLLDEKAGARFTDLSIAKFASETASGNIVPGGGAVAAVAGALGVSLGGMVANLTAQKKGWEHRWKEFSHLAEDAKQCQLRLLKLVDEDAKAFEQLHNALKIPVSDDLSVRDESILTASKNAIQISLDIMKDACASMKVLLQATVAANPNTASDTGVGAYSALAAVKGAHLNVRIYALQCKDARFVHEALAEADHIQEDAEKIHTEISALTDKIMSDLK